MSATKEAPTKSGTASTSSTPAPWAQAPSSTNVPHAFIPHPDTMSPTAAPWAGASRMQADMQLSKAAPELIAAQPTMPTLHQAVAQQGQEFHQFRPARKRITSAVELKAFLESQALRDFVGYILHINMACMGKKLSELAPTQSNTIQGLVSLLDTLNSWVDDIPPAQQSLRYGNPAFRTWHARLVEQAEQLLANLLPDQLKSAASELAPYLTDSFGNPVRIDYGTGHETTFVALLYCLARLGLLTEADCPAVAGALFANYIQLMRRIQTTYWLEPAGSHGVWGLDDYQFIPFIWGSAQLCGHPMIKPKSIQNTDVLEAYASEYLYLAAVKFVKQVKKGPLQETSPMLCDISAVPTWNKVNAGMVKMYQAEVLSKLPIMQHFLFSSLLPFPSS